MYEPIDLQLAKPFLKETLMNESTPLIEFRGIGKRYGTGEAQFVALHNIDLTIETGEFVAIMGPSGSGKSTAMSWIQKEFSKRGHGVLFVPETATELITAGAAPWTMSPIRE